MVKVTRPSANSRHHVINLSWQTLVAPTLTVLRRQGMLPVSAMMVTLMKMTVVIALTSGKRHKLSTIILIWLKIFMTLISPCDSYDCSGIPNSQCFSYDEGPSCSCDSNFDRYALQNDGSYSLNNTENKFAKESTTLCRSNLPCSTVRKNFSNIIVNWAIENEKSTICQEFLKVAVVTKFVPSMIKMVSQQLFVNVILDIMIQMLQIVALRY